MNCARIRATLTGSDALTSSYDVGNFSRLTPDLPTDRDMKRFSTQIPAATPADD